MDPSSSPVHPLSLFTSEVGIWAAFVIGTAALAVTIYMTIQSVKTQEKVYASLVVIHTTLQARNRQIDDFCNEILPLFRRLNTYAPLITAALQQNNTSLLQTDTTLQRIDTALRQIDGTLQ